MNRFTRLLQSRFTVHGVSNFEFNPTIRNAVSDLFKKSQVRRPPRSFAQFSYPVRDD